MEDEKKKKPTVAGAGNTVLKLGIGGVGVMGSVVGLKQIDKLIPDSVPTLVKQLGPGVATMLVSYLLSLQFKDERAKAAFFGLGIGGALDAIRKSLGDKIPFIKDNTPALSGMGVPGYAAVNQGDFAPSYYKENAFQGFGNAFALSGNVPMNGMGNAFALSGGVPMNGGSAYSLT